MNVTSDEWILRTGRDAMDDAMRVLVTGLRELDDPRQAAKVVYPLPEMALVTVAAIAADCFRSTDRKTSCPGTDLSSAAAHCVTGPPFGGDC
jgi:hypothetical protein